MSGKNKPFNAAARKLGISRAALRAGNNNQTPSGTTIAAWMQDPPDWLVEARVRFARSEFDAKWRKPLRSAIIGAIEEAWFQELKTAETPDEIAAIDERWSDEITAARREISALLKTMDADRIRARIRRERDSVESAAKFRAGRLAQIAADMQRPCPATFLAMMTPGCHGIITISAHSGTSMSTAWSMTDTGEPTVEMPHVLWETARLIESGDVVAIIRRTFHAEISHHAKNGTPIPYKTVCGWRAAGGVLTGLSAEATRASFGKDAETGAPRPVERGVLFADGENLGGWVS